VNEEDWPDVQYLRALPQQSPQWNKFSEVIPIFSRTPDGEWCSIFTELAEGDELIDWKTAGFARCLHEEAPLVSSRFAVITDSANLEFRAFLGHGLSRTNGALEHRQIEDLIKLEASWAASGVGNGSTCGFS
jgi:hypothetical protein